MTDFTEIKNILGEKTAQLDTALEGKASTAEVNALKAEITELKTVMGRANATKADNSGAEYHAALDAYFRAPKNEGHKATLAALEAKSMNTLTGPAGGYHVPTEILPGIQHEKIKVSAIRRLADVISVNTPNISKVIETSGFGYEWVSETGDRSETATPVYASRVPSFGILAAKAPITHNMIEDSTFNIVSEVITGINNAFYKGESKAFIDGTGVNQPTGLLTGTTIGTVNSGAAAGFSDPFVFLDLIDAVDPGYHTNAVFLMNSKTKNAIAKFTDSNGNSLVQESVVNGVQATLWGFPIEIDNNMPDIAPGAKPVLFGNFFDGYLIADRGVMKIMEDPYTNLAYVNFIGRKRVGGVVKDARALRALVIAE